jgi:hypothetical protein
MGPPSGRRTTRSGTRILAARALRLEARALVPRIHRSDGCFRCPRLGEGSESTSVFNRSDSGIPAFRGLDSIESRH